jgi:hypothetical protein
MYTLQIWMRSARVSFLTCIQAIRSEREEQKHWREVWSATPPSPLSISTVHSADMDAFSARVVSHVYSANLIGYEGAQALARSLERNSSLTSLHLSCTLCRYECVPHACHFSRVFSKSDRKGRGRSTGAKSGAQLVPHISPSLMYTLQIWMRSARVSFLTCIQGLRSERRQFLRSRMHWTGTAGLRTAEQREFYMLHAALGFRSATCRFLSTWIDSSSLSLPIFVQVSA